MSPVAGKADRPEVVVRPARKNDATALGAFFIRAWKEAGPGALGFTGATEDSIKAISSTEFLIRRLASPNVRVIIAEREKDILGFASTRALGKREGELSGVVVLESSAGMGLGSKLVSKACDAAAKMGLDHLRVKTEAPNAKAINFYKKNKFTESRRTTEKVGRTKTTLVVLQKRLSRWQP